MKTQYIHGHWKVEISVMENTVKSELEDDVHAYITLCKQGVCLYEPHWPQARIYIIIILKNLSI